MLNCNYLLVSSFTSFSCDMLMSLAYLSGTLLVVALMVAGLGSSSSKMLFLRGVTQSGFGLTNRSVSFLESLRRENS